MLVRSGEGEGQPVDCECICKDPPTDASPSLRPFMHARPFQEPSEVENVVCFLSASNNSSTMSARYFGRR